MSLIDEYIRHGWSLTPIRPGTKSPYGATWNNKGSAMTSSDELRPDYGVGLMHAYSGTCALDIDNWALTRLRINVDELYDAPDAVQILSGKPGHGKLLYRLPFGLTLPSKQYKVDGHLAYELRCATTEGKSVQDLLPPSVHPETGMAYAWGGAGDWKNLPVLPLHILEMWQKSLADIRPPVADGVDSSWKEIEEALGHIDPSCGRDQWIRVGMALHWTGEQTWNDVEAFTVWDTWSRGSDKYPGERAMVTQWASFRNSKGSIVTLGTLFAFARQGGWVRAVPDASCLFGSTMVKPHDVIATMKPSPPDVDLDLWPKPLVQRAKEVSHTVGCDPLVPLWSGLAAVCAVIDAQTRLELMDGFEVPPVLWLMTLGDPGDRKTPGSKPMLKALAGIEASDAQRYAQARDDWEFKFAQWSSAKKARLEFAGQADSLLDTDQAPTVPPEPAEPVPLRFTVTDTTSQKLVDLCINRPRGILGYYDEMHNWVYRVCNGNTGENRSAWVMAYESSTYHVDRMGRGSSMCQNFAVSIYGNMQPRLLNEYFDSLTQDGLLQRFLPCVLRHDQTKMGNPLPPMMSSAGAWDNMLRQIYALNPTRYRLSDEAFTEYTAFQRWHLERMEAERLINSAEAFITAFGKMTGLAGRLILLFHAMEAPFSPMVDADLVRRVVRIMREFIIPTYRYVFDGEGSMSTFDRWLTEHIIQHADADRIDLQAIKTSARRQFEKMKIKTMFQQNEWVISGMFVLQQMGWVARTDDGSQEHRGMAEWLINPKLKVTFADYRKAVVKAKVERDNYRLTKAGLDKQSVIHGAELATSEL